MRGLASFFLEKNAKANSSDLWMGTTILFLQDQMISSTVLEELAFLLMQKKIQTEQEYYLFLRKTLCLLIFSSKKKEPFFETIEKKILEHIDLDWFFPARYMKNLIFYLLGKKDQQYSFAFLEDHLLLLADEQYAPHMALVNFANWAEMLMIVFILAFLTKDQPLLQQAKKSAESFFDLIFLEDDIYATLWTSEKHYDPMLSYCFFCLLSEMIVHFDPSFSEKVEIFLQKLQQENKNLYLFPVILSKWVQSFDHLPAQSMQQRDNFVFPSLATVGRKSADMRCFFTLAGYNSGLGSLGCGDVKIPSFGPQMFPLDNTKNFGLFRGYQKEKSFSDVTYQCEKTFVNMKGWSRLCKERDQEIIGSDLWLFFQAAAFGNHADLSLHFGKQKIESGIAFVFYIQAKSCLVDEMTLLPKTLDRYLGTMPQKLSFRGKKASLFIKVKNEEKIHIIPLSGEGCFWESNFLLAIEPSLEKGPLEITIAKA